MSYLLLLPAAAPPVRLIEQPRAEDGVHADGDALDADQQDGTWTTEGHGPERQRTKSADKSMSSIVTFALFYCYIYVRL